MNLLKGICIEYFFSICQYTAVPVSTDSFPFNYVSYKDYPELCSVPYNLLGRKILKQFIQKCYGFFTLPTLKLANTLLLLMAITKTHSLSSHFSQLLHNLPKQCHMLFSKLMHIVLTNQQCMHCQCHAAPPMVFHILKLFLFFIASCLIVSGPHFPLQREIGRIMTVVKTYSGDLSRKNNSGVF